ncbi:MAG: hypothetical protein LBG92_06965, partial [Prevotellaceae bacterium]|nr:hypothetical protein [Prevotellaceae bacterium]
MIIANPIYDVVFKRLMENERAAKFFIGTLLEETVEAIDFKPQEMTHVIKRENEERILLSLLRLDFIATIRTREGGSKKILIEIQKANNGLDDAERFRRYLAEQYG